MKSDLITISTGVLQSSILGPLLFIIYINDINVTSNIVKAIIYADDTTLTSVLSMFNTDVNKTRSEYINIELSKVSSCLKLNKLALNVSKTKYMFCHNIHKHINSEDIKISIDNIKIEHVDEFNFLGLTIDKHLT